MTTIRSYATLDENGDVPSEQLGNAGAGQHPDLATHDTLGLATQAELTAHATATHAATQEAAEATAASALSGHAVDSTAVHGITDTATLSLTSHDHDADYEATGATATHSADTTAVHGVADTAALVLTDDTRLTDARAPTAHAASHNGGADGVTPAGIGAATTGHNHDAAYEATGAVATHAGLSNPHPTYETAAEVLAQIGTHEGLANPHPGYLTPAEADAAYQPIDSDLTAIAALTTTAFGRGLLALADAAALSAAHTHSGATTTYAPGSFSVATGNYALMVKRLALTTTQRVSLAGTARLRIT